VRAAAPSFNPGVYGLSVPNNVGDTLPRLNRNLRKFSLRFCLTLCMD